MGQQEILTETELLIMSIIWSLKETTVHNILDQLPKEKPLAYTSVSTIVRILEKKGYVHSEKVGRGHVYKVSVSKADYEKKFLKTYIKSLFSNNASSLLKSLLAVEDISAEEFEKIKKLIEGERK